MGIFFAIDWKLTRIGHDCYENVKNGYVWYKFENLTIFLKSWHPDVYDIFPKLFLNGELSDLVYKFKIIIKFGLNNIRSNPIDRHHDKSLI